MPHSEQQQAVVARIAKRLASDAPETMRAGARAALIQAIEHRAPMVRALRQALAGLPESNDLRVLGYRDLLGDLLIAAEATLEPREQEADARLALESSPEIARALVALAGGPRTPGAIAQAIDVSVSSGTRYFQRLRALGLADAFSSRDGREVPHMLTPLGKRLAAECASHEAVSERRAVGVDDDEVHALKVLGG